MGNNRKQSKVNKGVIIALIGMILWPLSLLLTFISKMLFLITFVGGSMLVFVGISLGLGELGMQNQKDVKRDKVLAKKNKKMFFINCLLVIIFNLIMILILMFWQIDVKTYLEYVCYSVGYLILIYILYFPSKK